MLSSAQLKALFAKHGIAALKRLGQNYLIDANIKDKIIAAVAPSGSDTILEIGPGLGALTEDLAASGAAVYAVEKDRKTVKILGEFLGGRFPNLTVIEADILDFDIAGIGGEGKIKVVGNLPYNITTPIIERLIAGASRIDGAVVMVQREFAARLMARPGSKEYGSLSCFVQYYMQPSYLRTIKPTAFFPPPEVDSSLIRLGMRSRPAVTVSDEKHFFSIIRNAFNQRRKTVLNSLSRESALAVPKDSLAATLRALGIDPSSRPETLSLQQFADIANAVGK